MTATKQRFLKWTDELEKLKDIQIPRYLLGEINESDDVSVHKFHDTSKNAYAAVITRSKQ